MFERRGQLTLVEVAIPFVGRFLPEATVRRTAVVADITQPFDDRWEKPLVDVACGEIGLPEIRLLIRVIELQLRGLGQLIICNSKSIDGQRRSPRGTQ